MFTVPSADGRFDEEIIIAKLIVPAELVAMLADMAITTVREGGTLRFRASPRVRRSWQPRLEGLFAELRG